MTEWNTEKRLGIGIGIGIMVVITLIDGGMIWLATTRPLTIGTFTICIAVLLSFGLLGILGYWVYGLIYSEYLLDRNMLIIRWGPVEQVVPTGQIERVLTGDEIEDPIRFYGGAWPGHCVGYGEIHGIGPTLFYAAVPLKRQIYIVTPGLTYGISPANAEGFLTSLHKRLQMGPTQIIEQSSKRPAFLEWPIWRDRVGLGLLVASSLTLLALTGFLCFRFPVLPWMVPLHFDATGVPDRLEPRAQIFIFPLIGLLTLLLNGTVGVLAYHRERMISYLLWGGATLIQILVWTALIGILGQL